MIKKNGEATGSAVSPRSIFLPEHIEQLFKTIADKHTGIVVTIEGVTIDLLPLSAAEGMSVWGYVREFGRLFRMIKSGEIEEPDFLDAIGDNLPDITKLMYTYIARCLGFPMETVDGTPVPLTPGEKRIFELDDMVIADCPERAGFRAWFSQVSIVNAIKVMGRPFLDANGMGILMARPTAPEGTQTPPPEVTSTSTN